MLARAAVEPSTLVLGVDASPAGFVEASRRAARPPRRGGLANVAFVVAAAEDPPAELLGCADALTIAFPWGSLLRGALALDEAAAAGISALLAPGATAAVVLAPARRDGLVDLPTATDLLDPHGEAACELRERWHRHGLTVDALRAATPAEVDATHSTWARRLRAGRDADRPVARFDLRRPSTGIVVATTGHAETLPQALERAIRQLA